MSSTAAINAEGRPASWTWRDAVVFATDGAALAATVIVLLWPALSRPDLLLAGIDMHVFRGWELQIRRAFAEGQWPLWNPYAFAGYPSLADIETGLFYPPSVALRWLAINSFFAWNAAFHLWLIGVGAYAAGRAMGLRRPASLVAGFGLAACGTIAPRLAAGHLNIIFAFAWLPLAFALALSSWRRPGAWPSAGLVLVLACAVLAGFPQVTLYVAGWLGLYWLFALVWPDPDRHDGHRRHGLVAQAALAAVLAAGLTAFFLAPALRFAVQAGRAEGLTYLRASAGEMALSDLASVVFPSSAPGRRVVWDGSLFVGLLPLAFAPLALVARRQRRMVVFILLALVLSLVFALGDAGGLYRVQYLIAPGFRIPGRVLFLASFALTLLGAIGLDRFLDRDAHGRAGRWIRWTPVATLVIVPALVVFAVGVRPSGQDARIWLAGLAGVSAIVVTRALRRFRLAAVVAVLVAAFESVTLARPFVEAKSRSTHTVLAELASRRPSRVVSACEREVSASDLLVAALPTPDGFGGLSLGHYARFVNAVTGRPDTVTFGRIEAETTDWPVRLDLLAWLNVTHIVGCGLKETGELPIVARVGELTIHTLRRARPRAFLACAGTRMSDAAALWRLRAGRYDADLRLVLPPPEVAVRWAPAVTEADRAALERRYGLTAPELARARTWRYRLADRSPANVRALVAEPAVEDTDGIDRPAGRVIEGDPPVDDSEPGEGQGTWLVGLDACDVAGEVTVRAQDRPDGLLDLEVATPTGGLVVMSEPFFVERVALVDGRPAPTERVNVAFTGVAVEPGRHTVQLRVRPTSLYSGSAVTAGTILIWLAAGWQRRRRCRGTT